jgi:diguanylate cyclase (GGDEF)-like protein
VLIIMMAALIGHATWQVNDLEDRMSDIVEIRNQKIQLATDLQEASYNRHNALVYQVLARDPFERDDYFQQYIKWGYHVGLARNALKAMSLDGFELESLMRQDELIARIIDEQETISDLAARGRMELARERMAGELRPLNRAYTERVEALRRHERDLIQSALAATRSATQRAILLHVLVGAALILLATFIAAKTRALLGQHATTILDQVSELEQAGTRLAHEATHDPLTGLANRSLFYRRLEEAMAHAAQDRFCVAVMYVDLDDFKRINDSHGHAVGDAMLREVSTRLRKVARLSDTAARLGGDEFALLFVGIQETSECPPLCGKVEKEVSQPMVIEERTFRPSCSIGYALYPRDGEALDDLLKTADGRMYEAKRTRKDQATPRAT